LALRRAKAEPVPDIVARGGLHYNRELLELGAKPVGWEGFFDVTIEIPIFNRNQGNVSAARAELERAQLEAKRVKLALRARFARVSREYVDAFDHSQRYRNDMLPRAQRAYELYLGSFRQMAAAYPQVLIAQRNLAQVQEDYTAALVDVWRSAVEIQGLLLTEGLESPATLGTELARSGVFGGRRAGMPNMREGNAP
jgi:cobalt-zinc-cadmium efflux system outer membrane protein